MYGQSRFWRPSTASLPAAGRPSVSGPFGRMSMSGPSGRFSASGGPGSGRPSRNSNFGAGPGARDVDFDFVIRHGEQQYPAWWTCNRLKHLFYSLCEDSFWNAYICFIVLLGIVWVAVRIRHIAILVLDIIYNVSYALHVFGLAYSVVTHMDAYGITYLKIAAFLVDIFTFSHHVSNNEDFKLLCYYLRLHRPFSYLWALNDYNLKGSVLGTTLKFCYIFLVMRVTWALAWLNINALEGSYWNIASGYRAMDKINHRQHALTEGSDETYAMKFLGAVYLVNKMFVPIGPSVPPANDIERVTCLFIMLSGCLVVTAFAVAALSLVISLYMRPEETFRARYRLIMKEMSESHIPPSQSDRVETFYKMFWHKHRAVSATKLLPTFPPTLPSTIFTDIYFEATQKSRVLRDLSYQFLSELSKKMETIHYIPGDAIIKRLSKKSAYIYITYGDVEMVTAEDDSTAILRLTRGTALTPCGVCAPAGLGRAHLEVRAASFCTAHVLDASELWKVVVKHGETEEESNIILGSYEDHLERVKAHYKTKLSEEVKHKSSILHFKRSLMALKEAKDANGNLLLARTDVFLEIAKSYIMRNRADATLTDESDAICLRPTFPCILQPVSSLQMAWNLFMASLILGVCFIHPYYLVFTKLVPIEFRFFDYVVTAVFVLDLIVHLSTGANVEEGVPITFSQTSSQQMRSHWFVLDVLGTVPIFEFIGTGHFAGINKILRLPKVFQVLKDLEDACVYRSNVLRFLSYTLLLLIACYLIAALQQGFMCFKFDYCIVTNLTHSPYWEHKPLDETTVQNRVSFALYWAISMIMFTTHMETWGNENWNNVLYTLCVLEICIVLRIFMEAVYSATILVTTALREDYDASISTVKNFLIRNQIDPVLRQRFISYFQLCWFTDKAYAMTNKRSIFYDLPQHVYQDIVAKQRSKYLLALPFMKYVSKEDLKTISSKAKLFYTSANEILLNTGDISNEMYVIKQGICEIVSPEDKRVVGLLNVKNHFGVLACLLRIPAFYTIRAVTNVQVFSVSRKYLIKAIEVPNIKDAMEYVKILPEYQRLMVRRKSFLKFKEPEAIPNWEQFPLPRKHEQDAAFLHPFYRLGFLSVLRYIFPRFTIRPDGKYIIRYEWFRAACAFASAMVFPCYSYLVLQWPWLYYVTLLLDISAYFDIVQRMLVGYYNEMGILVYHPSSTAAHYVKGAFLVDLFGCIPLEYLETPRVEMATRIRVTRMEQVLMMNRLIQMYRLPSAMLILRRVIERRDILTVFKAIPLFIVTMNVLASFMVFYSVTIYFNIDDGSWRIVPLNDEGGSWVQLFKNAFRFNMTESPWNLHLAAFFWVVYEATTTGYSIFKPSNSDLIHILFVGNIIGAMMITYFSVRIISIRANVNKALAEFQEHMKDMVVYMKRENLKPELVKEVMDYYEYNWDKMGGVDYRNVFKLCQQITLRTDAILHIYGPTFAKCPILAHCDVSLLRIVGRAVHSAYFLRDMNVIEANDVVSDMYFVDYGGMEARETVADMSTVLKLPRGSVFGNLDGLPTVCCPMTFVATSRVHLLMINSATFHNVIKEFPVVQQLMQKFRPDYKNSYIMGDVADNALVQHQRSMTSSPVLVTSRKGLIKHLYFEDTYVQTYLIIISLLCVYIDVYNAGFQNNSMPVIITLYVLDLCFFLKILLHYTLPLIVDTASVRKILLPIRKEYFRGEFRYDLVSCIPIELLSFLSVKYRWMIFACLRLNRMFRIVTVYKCLKRHHERITINLILSVAISAFIWFTLFVHTTTSLWYFIGTMEDRMSPKSSWIYKDDGSSWCHNTYICSVYFVLTTFTQNGVGDIMPKRQSEVIFVCILEIFSTMIYMIYVGEFSNIIQYQSFRSFSFYSKYLELQDFLKNNRVSKNLVHLVNKYSLHLWRETRGMQAPDFLKTAPQALRLKIMSAAYLHHLTRHHVFENCEPAFLRQLVGCLQLLTYNEDMYVVKSSEITDSMYLIHTGKIEEIAEETHKIPRIYPSGSYFGVAQGLMHGLPYTHSYRTQIKSQVLTLCLDDWFYLLKHYPVSRDAIHQHMRYDDTGDTGGADEGWTSGKPKPKPPKPPKPTKPMLVTEVVDKGSPPTPPKEDEVAKKPFKFTVPEGPRRSQGQTPLVTLDPGLWPTTSRDRRASSDAIVDITKDKHMEESRLTQRSSYSQGSALSFQPRGPKYAEEYADSTPFMTKVADTARKLLTAPGNDGTAYVPSDESSDKDVLLIHEDEAATNALIRDMQTKDAPKEIPQDRTEFIEKDILNKVLLNMSDSSISVVEEKTEEHMVTVDIAQSKADETETKVDMNIFPFYTPEDLSRSDMTLAEKNAVPDKIKKKTNVHRHDDESFYDVNEPIAGTSKDERKSHAETKDSSTSTRSRRTIRVRYEDDSNVDDKQRRHSTDYHPYYRQSNLADMSATERNLRMLDSDISSITSRRYNDEDELSVVGSNTSVLTSSSSGSVINKKKKKKIYKHHPSE